LQVPFTALGLVPENGSALSFSHSIGVHPASDFLMFGCQLIVEELEQWGVVNRIFLSRISIYRSSFSNSSWLEMIAKV